MAIKAGAVIVEVELDTKKAKASLEAFKKTMQNSFGQLNSVFEGLSVRAALVGNQIKESAKVGAMAHKELAGSIRATGSAMNGINNVTRKVAKTNVQAFSTLPINEFNGTAKKTHKTLMDVHGRLLMLSAAVSMTFKKAIRTGVIFENEMRKVKAVVGATDKELVSLTNTARMLGRNTTFMASEVAKAMKILGQAGFSTTQIQDSIGDVLNLSRAASISLERSAQVMISVAKTFEIEARNISQVGDLLVKVANNSATNVDLLGASFSFVGSTAVATGQSLKGVSTMLGVLANRGLRGTKAGTALNEALLRLSQTDMIEKMEAMGVAVKTTSGKMRSLSAIFRDLQRATAYMDEIEQAGHFIKVFGRRGARAGILIARAGDAVDDMRKKVDDAGDESQKTARDMERNLLAGFRLLHSAAEELAITFKDSLRPALIRLTRWGKKLVDWLSTLINTTPQVGEAIAVIAAGLATLAAGLVSVKFIIVPLLAIFKPLAGGISSAASAVWNFTAALKGLTMFRIHQWVFGLKMKFWALKAAIQGATIATVKAKAVVAATMLAYGAILVMVGAVAKAYWDMATAQDAARRSQEAANKAGKDFLKTKVATRKEVEKALTSDIANLKGAGKSDAEILKTLKQWVKDNAARKAAALNGIKTAVKEQDARIAEKVLDQAIREEKVLKNMIKKGIADIKAPSPEDLLDKGALKLLEINRRESQLKALEKVETEHAKKLADIKARIAEDADNKAFRQRLKNKVKEAGEEAKAGRAEALAALENAKKLAAAQKKALTAPGAMDADTARLEELKRKRRELVGKTDEASMKARSLLNTQIARQTELINAGGTAQQKYLETLKEVVRQTELLGKQQGRVNQAQEELDKQRASASKLVEKAEGRVAAVMERTRNQYADFLSNFERVTGTIAVSTATGGSLAERLGATDPNITLNKKALEVQMKQQAELAKQTVLAEKTLEVAKKKQSALYG